MPNLDGVSATHQIRQFDQLTPIISMTSNTTEDDCITYLATGMNDILAKPFSKASLYRMLERYCSHLSRRTSPPPSLGPITPTSNQDERSDSSVFDNSIRSIISDFFARPPSFSATSLVTKSVDQPSSPIIRELTTEEDAKAFEDVDDSSSTNETPLLDDDLLVEGNRSSKRIRLDMD